MYLLPGEILINLLAKSYKIKLRDESAKGIYIPQHDITSNKHLLSNPNGLFQNRACVLKPLVVE